MPNLELTISPEYVGDWNIQAAIREIYQNALDQQTVDPENELLFDYNPQTLVLRIGNRKSALDVSTLVLGKTSKAKNENVIGQFGEGYKLALAVLLRLGKTVTIYNNPSVWTPTIKISEAFNTAVLNINIIKYRFKACPEHDLIFSINGITAEEYATIVDSNRNLHTDNQHVFLIATQGVILLDPKYKGQIFVRGLHITTLPKAAYGYDFYYKTAAMWAGQAGHAEIIKKMIEDKAPDIEHIDSYVWQIPTETVKYIGGSWYCEHGCTAYPVTSQREADSARSLYGNGAKIIIVSEQLMAILKRTDEYKNFTATSITKEKPYDLLRRLLKHPDRYRPAVFTELKTVVELAKHWDWKRV